MPDNKERRPFGFLRGFLRRLCGGFSRFFSLCRPLSAFLHTAF